MHPRAEYIHLQSIECASCANHCIGDSLGSEEHHRGQLWVLVS